MPDEHHLILVGVAGICFKIIWDWLSAPRRARQAERVENHIDHVEKMNGHMEATLEDIRIMTHEMNDRQKKIWDHTLATEVTIITAAKAAAAAAAEAAEAAKKARSKR